MKTGKIYAEACRGFRISFGKLRNRILSDWGKSELFIKIAKDKYIGKLKYSFLELVAECYLQTRDDYFFELLFDMMKNYSGYYLKKFPFLKKMGGDEINQAFRIGILEGLNTFDKNKGFIFNSIKNGVLREFARVDYYEKRFQTRNVEFDDYMQNSYSEIDVCHNFIKQSIREEFNKAMEKEHFRKEFEILLSGGVKELRKKSGPNTWRRIKKAFEKFVFENAELVRGMA